MPHLSEDERRKATERFQEIQAAFERICETRSWDLNLRRSELIKACEGAVEKPSRDLDRNVKDRGHSG